jgi:hypothetical protein
MRLHCRVSRWIAERVVLSVLAGTLVSAVMTAYSHRVAAEECTNYNQYLHAVGSVATPGAGVAVVASGKLAFVADGTAGLQVIDISAPELPIIVGSVDTPGYAQGVAVSGNYVFVADQTGLQIVDASVPQSPVLVGSVDTPGDAHEVAILGSLAYVADASAGVQIVDISVPDFPIIVGSLSTPDDARGIAVSGSYAYVAGVSSGLLVVDLSLPDEPAIAGSVDHPGIGYAVDVTVALPFAYVAVSSSSTVGSKQPVQANAIPIYQNYDAFSRIRVVGQPAAHVPTTRVYRLT